MIELQRLERRKAMETTRFGGNYSTLDIVAAVGTPKGNGDRLGGSQAGVVGLGCSGWNAERQWRLRRVVHERLWGEVAAVGTPKGNGDFPRRVGATRHGGVAAVGTPKGNGDVFTSEKAAENRGVAAVGTPKGNGDACADLDPKRLEALQRLERRKAMETSWHLRFESFVLKLQRLERRKAMETRIRGLPLDQGIRCSGWNAERQWRRGGWTGICSRGSVAAVGTPKGNGDDVGHIRS